MALKILHVVNIPFVIPYYLGRQINYFNDIQFDIACSPSSQLEKYSKEFSFTPVSIDVVRSFNIWRDAKSIYKLYHLIKNNKYDLVIGHTPKGALIGMAASCLAGTPKRIYFRHGIMLETSSGLKRVILLQVERLTSTLATKVVCVSRSVLNKSVQLGLDKEHKCIILGNGTCNGVDIRKYSLSSINTNERGELMRALGISSDELVIGFVGRLVNDKGIGELIQAWIKLTATRQKVKLLLVGPFEERDELSVEIRDIIKSTPSIIQTGLVEEPKLYYSIMDIFILPSYREGYPTVVLEASCMELPVITTKATGCIDAIVENSTGVYTDITADSIKKSIEFYLDNASVRRAHGKSGRELVEKQFAQEIVWEEIRKKVINNE